MMEKIKRDSYMVQTVINMFERKELRLDHPNQRTPDTWSNDYRDGYTATIIKGEDVDSIKICEEINKRGSNNWVIDGGHRVDTLWKFKHNVFRIGNKIARPIVAYSEEVKDDHGNYKINEYDEVVTETKKCDLRGKYYKDLPDKLKESFDNNKVQYVKHLNCDNEEIVYHIVRYNKQKSMNTNENIVARMSNMAGNIKAISKKNRFFKDCGVYTEQERKNSSVERCIVEAVMCINHFNNWKKQTNVMADYIDVNTNAEEFETLNKNLNELLKIVPKEANKLFNTKDSFIWFTIYSRFKSMENNLEKFTEFLKEFSTNEDLQLGLDTIKTDSNSTKDKAIIERKLNYIENAMKKHLRINVEETHSKEISTLDFVKENVGQYIEQEDINTYIEDFELYTLDVDNRSKLMDENNKPSFLALIAYGYKEDIQLDEWFVDFFNRNTNYITDQQRNYLLMVNDLDRYIEKTENNKLSTVMINNGRLACAM